MKYSVKTFPEAAQILVDTLPERFGDQGTPIDFKSADTTRIEVVNNTITVHFANLADGWCALGDHLFGRPAENTGAVAERGLMLDASRNAVPTIPYLKVMLTQLVLCGLNRFCIYTEDTYSVDGEPLIGYGRGRYSKEELQELDRFASDVLGIEMFPCIQTLGHFEQTLRYQHYTDLRDNPRVLNTNLDDTYRFIDTLIDSAVAPYRSKRIHLGLDEPWGLGRGASLDFNAPKTPGLRFAEHLAHLGETCRKRGLQPMAWGDYLLGHSGETPLTDDEAKLMPSDVRMVYWDYENEDPDIYRANIAAFRKLGYEPVCAPTAHAHNRFFVDFARLERTAAVFADVMIEEKINDSLFTVWGDDGHECLNIFALPAIIYYLACVRGQRATPKFFDTRCEAIAGFTEKQLRVLSRVTDPAIPALDNPGFYITGKMLLWDDPMHRFVTRMVPEEAVEGFRDARWNRGDDKFKERRFAFAEAYCTLICAKVSLINTLTQAYTAGDHSWAAACAHTIPEILMHIENFGTRYRELWLAERKPFGLEIFDHRLGGLYLRTTYWHRTLLAWCRNECDRIPELEDHAVPRELASADLAFHNRIFTRCYQLWS